MYRILLVIKTEIIKIELQLYKEDLEIRLYGQGYAKGYFEQAAITLPDNDRLPSITYNTLDMLLPWPKLLAAVLNPVVVLHMWLAVC